MPIAEMLFPLEMMKNPRIQEIFERSGITKKDLEDPEVIAIFTEFF